MGEAGGDQGLGLLAGAPDVDRWVDLSTAGRVLVRCGKVELGQGIRTALTAIAADELGVDPGRVEVSSEPAGTTMWDFVTAASASIEQGGTAVRQACAHARRFLLGLAAEHLGVAVEGLVVDDGTVTTGDGAPGVSYWDLMAGRRFGIRAEAPIDTVPVAERRWIGRGLARVDLPPKVTGKRAFVHDLRFPGLRHGRVVRPPRQGARLVGDVPASVGGATVVRRGSFLAVVAGTEADAVAAAAALATAATWEGGGELVLDADRPEHLVSHVAESLAIVDGDVRDGPLPPPLDHGGASAVLRARYSKPYLMHGSIGPSSAVARFADGRLAVWSHSQATRVLRPTLAEVLGLPEDAIEVAHVEGAGCYGHNGADDVALDAALVAMATPGRHVSVTWSRDDEHAWEPVQPAMAVEMEAGLDADGRIASWQHEVYTSSHNGRPRPFGDGSSAFLASRYLDPPFPPPRRAPSRGYHMGGHRNADPLYEVGRRRVVKHFVADTALRTSSTRGLGAFANVFAIESFMDELAVAAGRDPVSFRLDHLGDRRAREVIEAAVDLAGGMEAPGGIDAPGRGLAFSQYENVKAYVAVVAEVAVDPRTGAIELRRAWIAADAGEVIDPDGLVNQLEGGLVQAASWALKERVGYDADGVTTRDWDSYPILRFSEVPEVVTVVLDRPGAPPLGAGEASTGPTPAAIANAVYQATGARLRHLPLTADRVVRALDELVGG